MSTLHSKRAAEYQKNPDTVTHHDQTFYNVRAKRDRMAQALPEWEELRDMADRIKRHTITVIAIISFFITLVPFFNF